MSRNHQQSDDFRQEEQRISKRLDQDAAKAAGRPGCWCSGDYSEFVNEHTNTCPYRAYLIKNSTKYSGPARDGIEAQHGLNDVYPGDPCPPWGW